MQTPQKDSDPTLQERIKKYFDTHRSCRSEDVKDENLSELFGLLALMRTWASEDMAFIQPLNTTPYELHPTTSLTIEFLRNATDSGIIYVDPKHSTETAFKDNSDGTFSWYWYRVGFQPSIDVAGRNLDISETISFLQGLLRKHLTTEQKRQFPKLMRNIAIDECVQYLELMLTEHGFNESIGDKTRLIFDELLDAMSVSQILPCIWSAVKSAAAFLQTPDCHSRKHAYNTIQGKIRDIAARRQSGERKESAFERHSRCPRSQISIELYGEMGFANDVGFTTRLADIPLCEEWQHSEKEELSEPDCEFTQYEKACLAEAGFGECSDFEWERPLSALNRMVTVQKFQQGNRYRITVSDISKPDGLSKIACAGMDDFTSVLVFTYSMERHDDIEYEYREVDN